MGILWRPLKVSVSKAALVVTICCKLHNYILRTTGSNSIPQISQFDTTHHIEQKDGTIYLQDQCDLEYTLHNRRRELETSELRSLMTEHIKNTGLMRPNA